MHSTVPHVVQPRPHFPFVVCQWSDSHRHHYTHGHFLHCGDTDHSCWDCTPCYGSLHVTTSRCHVDFVNVFVSDGSGSWKRWNYRTTLLLTSLYVHVQHTMCNQWRHGNIVYIINNYWDKWLTPTYSLTNSQSHTMISNVTLTFIPDNSFTHWLTLQVTQSHNCTSLHSMIVTIFN